ncbi:MAG: hypothetical protein GY710_14965, partial [Desulfobacteraceae bacterium]|nr:hypothetical protein [Desulfobacteraceae bacterium]
DNNFIKSVESILQSYWETKGSDSAIELLVNNNVNNFIQKCDELLLDNLGEKQFEKILNDISISIEKWYT